MYDNKLTKSRQLNHQPLTTESSIEAIVEQSGMIMHAIIIRKRIE